MPNTQAVFRRIAPRCKIWSGPKETALHQNKSKEANYHRHFHIWKIFPCKTKVTNSWPRSFKTPLNSYKCRFGGSHSTVPLKSNRSRVSSNPAVAGTACRIFKFVSPSKLDVSMNAIACGSLDDTRTKSAGKNALFRIRTMSPTTRFCHLMPTHWPFRSVSTSLWFKSSSARCRFYMLRYKIIIWILEISNWLRTFNCTYKIFHNLFECAYS